MQLDQELEELASEKVRLGALIRRVERQGARLTYADEGLDDGPSALRRFFPAEESSQLSALEGLPLPILEAVLQNLPAPAFAQVRSCSHRLRFLCAVSPALFSLRRCCVVHSARFCLAQVSELCRKLEHASGSDLKCREFDLCLSYKCGFSRRSHLHAVDEECQDPLSSMYCCDGCRVSDTSRSPRALAKRKHGTTCKKQRVEKTELKPYSYDHLPAVNLKPMTVDRLQLFAETVVFLGKVIQLLVYTYSGDEGAMNGGGDSNEGRSGGSAQQPTQPPGEGSAQPPAPGSGEESIDIPLENLENFLNFLRQVPDVIAGLLSGERGLGEGFDLVDLALWRYCFEFNERISRNAKPSEKSPSLTISRGRSRNWWVGLFGAGRYSVPFTEFFEPFMDEVGSYFGEEFREEVEAFLRVFLNFPDDNCMTTYKFNLLDQTLGPMRDFGKHFHEIVLGEGFVGLINRVHATDLLKGFLRSDPSRRERGVYLVRFSRTRPETLVATVARTVDSECKVSHFLLTGCKLDHSSIEANIRKQSGGLRPLVLPLRLDNKLAANAVVNVRVSSYEDGYANNYV